MKVLRWIAFIPLGIILGFVFALPIILFYNIWNLDNLFFTSVVKNGFSTYFIFLCMAWIVPNDFSLSGFKTLASILFGISVALSAIALLGRPDAQGILGWEYAGEVLGLTLGYLGATKWDKNSLRSLLANTEGVWPYTAYKN